MTIEEAARALVERLDFIHKDSAYQSVWTMAHIHGQPYRGPTYEKELQTLRVALSSKPESGKLS